MRKQVIAGVIIVALVGGGGYIYVANRSKAAAAQKAVQYVQVPVRSGTIRSTISGSGPAASVNGVSVKANQPGTVAKVLAQDGDRVKAGQVIMVLSNDSLEATLKQAQVDLTNNQANLDTMLNPQATAVRAQELKVESSRLTLEQRRTELANLTISAPISGVVSTIRMIEGSDMAANAVLFTLYDEGTPTFIADVPQAAAAALEPGQAAQVDLPGFGMVKGWVRQSGAPATATNSAKDAIVPVSIDLPTLVGVRPGMVGTAYIEAQGVTFKVQASGFIQNDSVEVRSDVAATAEKVLVHEGDFVKAGATLATLASDSVSLQLDQAENDLKTQQQNLDNLLEPSSDPSGQLRTLINKLEQSKITVASKQQDVDDLQVKAPVDGVISALTPRVGDKINQNAALFRVADYNAMQITITVDELDVAKAKAGQTAQITVDALPGKTFTGKVIKVNPEGVFKNDIATFEVTVQIDKPEGLMAGMNTTVNMVVAEATGLYVPAQAVHVQQGKAFVQVLENGQPVQKEIEVGLRTDQQVEVKGALKEGDQVIQTIVRQTQGAAGGFGPFGGGNRQQNQTTFPAGGQTNTRQGGTGQTNTRQGGAGQPTGGNAGGNR
jgi:HlyD family secretion protein